MAPFDECSVFIPVATLEDFPSHAEESDARSLLAAWTVLWHPTLLAQTEQLPTWYRADSPPEPDGPRIVVVPNSSFDQLPTGFENKCKRNKDCRWVTGTDREEMLAALGLNDPIEDLQTDHRTIGLQDFFAAGYTFLQVQIMTRRLRYTSNLDEIHLQKQIVQAAKSFIARDAEETASALHNVFDCLSEERDHYFSSDPHLIDLTLLTPSTVSKLVETNELGPFDQSEHAAVLDTPQNVLIDSAVADEIKSNSTQYASLRSMLTDKKIGWVGGAPDANVCFDSMTFSEAESVIASAHQHATEAIGAPPVVYGRFSGSTPADMTPALVRLGYAGIIPIDFARGSGHGDEAKVIQQSGGAEIESLTAKPIDASSDSAFLSIGAQLGEAIDSGEIATALLAHWPGQASQGFRDLRCAASWCLALGRFWKLDDYFREGESPYHHGTSRSVSSSAHESLTEKVAANDTDPIGTLSRATHTSIASECSSRLSGMTGLVAAKSPESNSASLEQQASEFALASGAKPTDSDSDARALMVVNPLPVSQRCLVQIAGSVSSAPDHVFAVSGSSNRSDVSVDVPAYGFATVQVGAAKGSKGGFFNRFLKSKEIAVDHSLQNEFMEVSISPDTGGIQGVYSGGTRGNRFSLRLAYADEVSSKKNKSSAETQSTTMHCDKLRIVESSESVGVIETNGKLTDKDNKHIADFTLQYRLVRGSRWVQVTGSIDPKVSFRGDPWKSYIAARAAVASESAITRVIVRDKLHRATSRRLVAPLGLVLDEAERQTLVGANGMAFHRRVGDRFVDTLLTVKSSKESHTLDLSYGFDVPQPVANAKSLITPPVVVAIEPNDKLPEQGWISHVSPADTMISDFQVFRREDGNLAGRIKLIHTRGKSASLVVRFCRDVVFATTLDKANNEELNQSLPSPDEEDATIANPSVVKSKDDTVRLVVSGHQVVDLLVVFKT